MGLERHTLFFDAAQLGQAEHLVAAAVRQDRPPPADKSVQTACALNDL
jgi:hypothetical protein